MKRECVLKSAIIALLCVVVFLITFTVVTNSSSSMRSTAKNTISTSVPDLLSDAAQSGSLGTGGSIMYGCEFEDVEIAELSKNYIVFYGKASNCPEGTMYFGCAVKTPFNRDYIINLDRVLLLEENIGQVLITDTSVPFVKAVIQARISGTDVTGLTLDTGLNVSDVVSCILVYGICFEVA